MIGVIRDYIVNSVIVLRIGYVTLALDRYYKTFLISFIYSKLKNFTIEFKNYRLDYL